MLNPKAIKTVSDLREDPVKVVKAAEELGEPLYVFNRATPIGVIMSLEQYQHYRELLEDYHDSIKIKEALEDPSVEWVPLDKFWKEMGFAKEELKT